MFGSYYNFTGKPFQLISDPQFFYKSKTHKRALAYLFYGLEQAEGFIVITGDVGTGKTTLVSEMLKHINPERIITANIVNTQINEDDLLRMVSAEFGLAYKTKSKAQLIQNLYKFFKNCAKEDKRVLLIVDESQNLKKETLEEIRMLSNLQWQNRLLLQCFLLGQKEFRQTMQTDGLEQLRQRVLATYHLRSLDLEETRHYIEHRLRVVGWDNNPTIEDDVFEGIFEYTQGIPRKINLLCSRILLFGEIEELNNIDSEVFESVVYDIKDEFWNKKSSYQAF